MQQMQVDNETKMAYARSQDGLAQERVAKIQSDRAVNAERLERAQENKSAGLLNIIKSLKEIQSIDIDHIKEGVGILNALKPQIETPKGQEQP